MEKRAEVGVFGGTGFYKFLEKLEEVKMETPYGPPSDKIMIGEVGGKKVAFLPRHGREHQYPPHVIPYRANLWAMKELGVTRIIGPCAAGSLHPDYKIGQFIFCDQFIDRTSGRKDTFYDGPITTHVSSAYPYCSELREIGIKAAQEQGLSCHNDGTVVVIQGPRFSTKAESKWFSAMGWQVINMTQFPECQLAKELEMCYLNISLITDYDAGLEGHAEINPVSHEEVVRIFTENNERLKTLVEEIIRRIPLEREKCSCKDVLKHSR